MTSEFGTGYSTSVNWPHLMVEVELSSERLEAEVLVNDVAAGEEHSNRKRTKIGASRLRILSISAIYVLWKRNVDYLIGMLSAVT